MAWGFDVRSLCCASSTGVITGSSSPNSSPHPVSNVLICLLIILLLTIVSPISAVAYNDHHQQSDGGVVDAAAAAGEIISRPGPPRVHQQRPAGDDHEQESKLLPLPAERGAIYPPSTSVQAEGSEGQDNCEYELSIRTSCSSILLEDNQQYSIKIWFGDASGAGTLVFTSTTRTRTKFAPCSVETLSTSGPCLGRICLVRMWYGGMYEEWIPNYVKVFSGETMDTICLGSSIFRGNEFDRCKYVSATGSTVAALPAATTTAPARTDDDEDNMSCGSAAETANIRPWISN